jgi:uncharacterized glyoxalase superfamily protein PhnB
MRRSRGRLLVVRRKARGRGWCAKLQFRLVRGSLEALGWSDREPDISKLVWMPLFTRRREKNEGAARLVRPTHSWSVRSVREARQSRSPVFSRHTRYRDGFVVFVYSCELQQRRRARGLQITFVNVQLFLSSGTKAMSDHGLILTPSAAYQDPLAAIAWLERAFGFEIAMLLTNDSGALAHAEMAFRGAHIGIMGEWSSPALLGPAEMKSPKTLGASTQFIWVKVDDVRAHCDRARAAGAEIVQEPTDQPYGDRTYRALDCEGHVWNFRQSVRTVPDAEFERQTGLKYRKSVGEVTRRR